MGTTALQASDSMSSNQEIIHDQVKIVRLKQFMEMRIPNYVSVLRNISGVPYDKEDQLAIPLKNSLGFYGNADPAYVMNAISELNEDITEEQFSKTRQTVEAMIGLNGTLKSELISACEEYKYLWKKDQQSGIESFKWKPNAIAKGTCETYTEVSFLP